MLGSWGFFFFWYLLITTIRLAIEREGGGFGWVGLGGFFFPNGKDR